MNAKILILALCAFQVACGQNLTAVVSQVFGSLGDNLAIAQTTSLSVANQLDQSYSDAKLNIQTGFQNAINSIQQIADSLKTTTQQAATQIQSCADQAKTNLTANFNAAAASSQSVYDSGKASLQSASQNLNATISNYKSAFDSVTSAYQTCYKQNGLLAPIICSAQVAANAITQFSGFISQAQQTIQAFYNVVIKVAGTLAGTLAGTSLNSASQVATAGAQTVIASIQQQADQFKTQISNINQQMSDCINKALNDTAATTTNTALPA